VEQPGTLRGGRPAEFRDLQARALDVWARADRPALLNTLGRASHYLQDQYALGHLFPGSNYLAGAAGAPFRFLVHQTVGGEVTLLGAQYEATQRFFRSLPAVHAL